MPTNTRADQKTASSGKRVSKPTEEMEMNDPDEGDGNEEMEMEDGYDKTRGDSAALGRSVPWEVYKATLDDLAAAELRFDSLEEQLAELEELVAQRVDSAPDPDSELVQQLVAERVDCLEKAWAITGTRERHDGLSNREVMELALEAAEVRIDGLAERSDEYVAARFDAAFEAAEAEPYQADAAQMLARQLGSMSTARRSDSGADGIAAAAAEHQQALAQAWQAKS